MEVTCKNFSQLLAFFTHLVYFNLVSDQISLLYLVVLLIEVVKEPIHIQITSSYIDTWRGSIVSRENYHDYINESYKKDIQQK